MIADFKKAAELLQDKLNTWFNEGILLLPNLIIAAAFFLIFIFLSGRISRLIHKLLFSKLNNKALANFLSGLCKFIVILLGLILAINILNLDQAVSSILAGVGIVGITLGFAFQDFTANLISGVALVLNKDFPFKVNDIIKTNDHTGIVDSINLRSTTIKTFEGEHVILPNRQIFENPIVNFTYINYRRVNLTVGVSYGDDLQKVEEVTLKAVKNVSTLLDSRPVQLYYKEFGDSSINFEVRFWIEYYTQPDFLEARHQAIKNIKKAYDENDITIPFPIRTLDFGIKGGSQLKEQFLKVVTTDAKSLEQSAK
jgi:small-conductance mechanosensitive channel